MHPMGPVMTSRDSLVSTSLDVDVRSAQRPKVSTFWHGDSLSSLDIACLMSFIAHGFDVKIYSYKVLSGLPSSLSVGDASDILDKKYLLSFNVVGRPSFSHFSDFFRMNLFRLTGETWIDCDLFCLRDFTIPLTGNFLAKETPSSINIAILRLEPADPRLHEMIDIAEGYASGVGFKWGATGPALITRVFGAEALQTAFEPELFYPVHWNDWWKPFLPAQDEWCRKRCDAANTLHLWNNIVVKSGYWKNIAPPEGSFLHHQLVDLGLIGLFSEVYPAAVMQQSVLNYINSRTGSDFTLRELARMTTRRAGQVIRKRVLRSSHSS